VGFDLERKSVNGTPAPLVEGVQVNSLGGWALYALAPDGSLAYRPGGATTFRLDVVDREGVASSVTEELRSYGEPRFSPDGRRIAVEADEDIWMLEVARGTLSRFTVDGGRDPVWTPDGTGVTYAVGLGDIFSKPADGSGEAEPLAHLEFRSRLGSWSPDGETLVLAVENPTTFSDIWVVPRGGEPSPWLATPFREYRPELSPDGKWLLYLSDESGQFEVYLQPFPGPGPRNQVSTAGGAEPSWSRDGREILYREKRDVVAVSFDAGAEPPVGRPRRLIEGGPYRASGSLNRFYDASPEGRHFAMLALQGQMSLTELRVVLNWLEELKERVPTE
jgi:Tol biopolymer transport system component